jgi:hypothetical protein
MSEETPGPVMLAMTNILRKPPPVRVGKLSENFVLPRTVELRKLIAVSVGVLAGTILWVMPVGLFVSVGHSSCRRVLRVPRSYLVSSTWRVSGGLGQPLGYEHPTGSSIRRRGTRSCVPWRLTDRFRCRRIGSPRVRSGPGPGRVGRRAGRAALKERDAQDLERRRQPPARLPIPIVLPGPSRRHSRQLPEKSRRLLAVSQSVQPPLTVRWRVPSQLPRRGATSGTTRFT